MGCVNIVLFGSPFVLRIVGSERSTVMSFGKEVSIHLKSSGFGEVIIQQGYSRETLVVEWRAGK